jgi:Spy/CpxP family protein refolding chaperone
MRKLVTTSALILALTAGGMAFAAADRHEGPPHYMKEALAKLPESKRDMVTGTFKSMREHSKQNHAEMRKLHEELRAIMTAPSFDKTAYLAKHKQLDALREKASDNRTNALVNLAGKLTQEERKILADAMPGGHRHGKFHKGKKPDLANNTGTHAPQPVRQ